MKIVYKITNKLNGKCYIGITSNSLEHRWHQHRRSIVSKRYMNSHLYNALEKYGLDNFTIEQIDQADSDEDLSEKEKYYILKLKTYDKKFGYNKTFGGLYGGKPTPETIKKMSENRKGRYTGKKHHNYGKGINKGKKLSKEHRENISKANKGNKSSPVGGDHYLARSIICVETGEKFKSISEAVKKYKTRGIYKALKRKTVCRGFHWEYIKDE